MGVMWNLIGGEALIAMDVIEEFAAYFKSCVFQLNHPWRYAYMFLLSTNGVLYDDPRVQKFIFENHRHIFPGITIDGTKRKHDMHRVFPDGGGSYDIVESNMRLALQQFPTMHTKVTFSHGDIEYLCESIIHLWEMGIREIFANVVYEDVWQLGDSEIFESQLRELADVALDRGFWATHRCTLFWEPDKNTRSDRNVCGSGKCAAVDWQGDIHGCIRFAEHSLSGSGKSTRPIGNIYTGFNQEYIRAFNSVRVSLITPTECRECNMQERCSWCLGHCYEEAESDTIFHRCIAICEMHKAQWRANQYYWEQLERKHGVKPTYTRKGTQMCLI